MKEKKDFWQNVDDFVEKHDKNRGKPTYASKKKPKISKAFGKGIDY